jgi:hypothetical protein
MSTIGEQRGIGELFGDLTRDVSGLFRKEIQLAKAEARENVGKAVKGIEAIAIGAVLAIGAIGVLLSAAVAGLSALLIAWGMGEAGAGALAALIVGIVVAIIAWTFIKQGADRLKAENLMLDRTAHSVARDATVIKEKVNGQL